MRAKSNRLLPVALLCLTAVACTQTYKAPKQPVVSISELQLSEDRTTASFELIVRNDYEADYVVTGGALTIAVGDAAMLELKPAEPVPIASYAVEVFIAEDRQIIDLDSLTQLDEMEQGLRQRVSYHVFGNLEVNNEGNLVVDQRGQLHATPGKPGNFRGPSGINRGDRRLRGTVRRN